MSADIIMFVPKPDPDREERLRKRMIDAANAVYQEIFPDTAPCEYVAPSDDPA
jgi:hypothetical protein